jgi:hypothetical protein
MNPAKLGKLDNHTQEQWKLPLPRFIEELYLERFGKTTPAAARGRGRGRTFALDPIPR